MADGKWLVHDPRKSTLANMLSYPRKLQAQTPENAKDQMEAVPVHMMLHSLQEAGRSWYLSPT